jgi:hypothetical protein
MAWSDMPVGYFLTGSLQNARQYFVNKYISEESRAYMGKSLRTT